MADAPKDQGRDELAASLIADFGDTKSLARLIKRAKKRCRPLWVKFIIRTCQTIVILLVIVLVPKVQEARREANRSVSSTRIKGIDTACYLYATSNRGEYPATLEALVQEGYYPAKLLVNPSRPELKVGYVYIKPIGLTAHELILYEAFDEWEQGILTNLGFITDEELFKKILAETQQGRGLSDETLDELRESLPGKYTVAGTPPK